MQGSMSHCCLCRKPAELRGVVAKMACDEQHGVAARLQGSIPLRDVTQPEQATHLVGLHEHAGVVGHHLAGGADRLWAQARPEAPHVRLPVGIGQMIMLSTWCCSCSPWSHVALSRQNDGVCVSSRPRDGGLRLNHATVVGWGLTPSGRWRAQSPPGRHFQRAPQCHLLCTPVAHIEGAAITRLSQVVHMHPPAKNRDASSARRCHCQPASQPRVLVHGKTLRAPHVGPCRAGTGTTDQRSWMPQGAGAGAGDVHACTHGLAQRVAAPPDARR